MPITIQSKRLFFVRAAFGLSSTFCLFLSFKYGQIGKSMLIFECSAIWTLIYGYFMYKNKAHIYSIWSIPIAFLGIYFILQPENGISMGDFYALLGSILNAGVYLSLKELRKNHNTGTTVLVSYSISGALISIPNIISFPSLSINITFLLIIMAIIDLAGQCLMTMGFKYSTAGIASLLMLSIVPLTTFSGLLFFNETFTVITWLGITTIFSALFVIGKWQ
jgi:drug/metabolite transporter (DMT)-like permease